MFLQRNKPSFLSQFKKLAVPQRGFKDGYKRAAYYFIWRLKRLPGTPVFIARGFAIGVAINFWPILFTHLLFGYIFCRLLKGSLLAMFIGTLLGNPWTFAIVYPINYKIGKIMLGLRPTHSERAIGSAADLWNKIWPIESFATSMHNLGIIFQEILFPLMIGGFFVGLPVTLLSYYLTRNIIQVYQAQRRRMLLKKFEAVEHDIEDIQPDHDEGRV